VEYFCHILEAKPKESNMAKEAKKYFKVHPWKIIEEGFDRAQGRVGESIFSLGNEYMGIRGQFDECYSADKLIGCYFNGVYEDKPLSYPEYFKGLAKRCCFMINANNWLYTKILLDGEEIDLAKIDVEGFYRELDMKAGIVTRRFTYRGVEFTFERFVSINYHYVGGQRITFRAAEKHEIVIESGIDFTPIHEEEGKNYWRECEAGVDYIICATESSGQRIYSKMKTNQAHNGVIKEDKFLAQKFTLALEGELCFEKIVYNFVERDAKAAIDLDAAEKYLAKSYADYRAEHIERWAQIWEKSDIEISGDEENQQGIRFCIFNMHQTYHGDDGRLNVGAKGLTGEKYSGWTFWDSETYCLPFYIFNNPKAAKNLLMYRYNTLPQAKERSIEQGCLGACYPMVTIDGTESCGVWQHGNLEIHVTAAVAYGVWHYVRNTGDEEFLKKYGIEMLVETARYFASRGGWSPKTGEFGLYGVMGPDEFHMMVHNNTYTNYMVKKNFYYTIEMVEKYGYDVPAEELAAWKSMADKMRISYDPETKLFEQHDGYFDLPEYDVKSMDPDKVPIYKYWAYDSIFRVNMLKQPDVVLMQFFYSKDFTLEEKKANFEYYERRCSHESSLSPAVHSIMAAEIGDLEMAEEYMAYGSRVDIDDYNRNTHQGLHVTSMAAAWMNIVYGFGGMRSDGEKLTFAPKIPKKWTGYEFKIIVRGLILAVKVTDKTATFSLHGKGALDICIFDKPYTVTEEPTVVELA
jgi:maltose phosphorylase